MDSSGSLTNFFSPFKSASAFKVDKKVLWTSIIIWIISIIVGIIAFYYYLTLTVTTSVIGIYDSEAASSSQIANKHFSGSYYDDVHSADVDVDYVYPYLYRNSFLDCDSVVASVSSSISSIRIIPNGLDSYRVTLILSPGQLSLFYDKPLIVGGDINNCSHWGYTDNGNCTYYAYQYNLFGDDTLTIGCSCDNSNCVEECIYPNILGVDMARSNISMDYKNLSEYAQSVNISSSICNDYLEERFINVYTGNTKWYVALAQAFSILGLIKAIQLLLYQSTIQDVKPVEIKEASTLSLKDF